MVTFRVFFFLQDFATQGEDDEDNQAMLSDLVFMADGGGEHEGEPRRKINSTKCYTSRY